MKKYKETELSKIIERRILFEICGVNRSLDMIQ